MWLLDSNTVAQMQSLAARVTGSQVEAFGARGANSSSTPMTVQGSVASIPIKGVLSEAPDLMAWLFGGGNPLYSDIVSSLAEANENPDVKSIVFEMDSPGGTVAGLFDALDAISRSAKPITTHVGNMAASAAYALASKTDSIVATQRASAVGSIGVVASYFVRGDIIDITSTDAPNAVLPR